MPASFTRRLTLWLLVLTCSLLTACQTSQRASDNMASSPQTSGHSSQSTTEETERKTCPTREPVVKTRVVTRTEVIYQPVELDHKLVVGGVETAYFPNMGQLKVSARVDTGATTSSLHVKSEKEFERDGRPWVSFLVPVPGLKEPVKVERPLARKVFVKRKGKESQERLVVMLTVRLGKLERTSEFTLTDRDNFEFPALIGRNFLTDMAIVDVSHEYLATEK
ncbi:ATP-dependent zinc protease family protein [Sansalvadorimonas verongulae]|uniref:ATP-dependent zinc protease family protein n=1 Tax=Sansalvadorimonas verongulae TaxID=2172824 RepID=UPI0012BD474B|nr:RimK/LysX family protein [Sansalvadorimonas verongulae]MTI12357.1 hypothetical protein [Sansalvadorimonas verongulae]